MISLGRLGRLIMPMGGWVPASEMVMHFDADDDDGGDDGDDEG